MPHDYQQIIIKAFRVYAGELEAAKRPVSNHGQSDPIQNLAAAVITLAVDEHRGHTPESKPGLWDVQITPVEFLTGRKGNLSLWLKVLGDNYEGIGELLKHEFGITNRNRK